MISAFGGSLWVFGQANLFILNTHLSVVIILNFKNETVGNPYLKSCSNNLFAVHFNSNPCYPIQDTEDSITMFKIGCFISRTL